MAGAGNQNIHERRVKEDEFADWPLANMSSKLNRIKK